MESGKQTEATATIRRLPKFMRRKTPGDIVFDIFNYLFLILFALTIIYPYWSTFLLSFSDNKESTSLGLHLWIENWDTQAYKFALSKYGNVPLAYFNSIFRTVIGTVLTLIFTLLAAYPLSKKNLPGRNLITIYFLITMFFSGGIIPLYLLVRNIGLTNTRWSLILPRLVFGFHVIIMRNFLMTIDNAYEESAFIDGANYFQIALRIIIPLSKPVIATIALWNAVAHWNSWFDAMIYIRSESKIVLQLLVRRMIQDIWFLDESIRQFQTAEKALLPTKSVKAAITIITIGPIILLYPFIQKHFIKGVFLGSLKG